MKRFHALRESTKQVIVIEAAIIIIMVAALAWLWS